jgi:hypothetical protein
MEATELMTKISRMPLGDVIAERVLDASKDGQLYKATVRVGRPVRFSDGPRYLCPYQIAGIGDDVVRSAAGEDSLQAIELAFKMLGADLYYRHKDFRFTWLGQPAIGFPNPNM